MSQIKVRRALLSVWDKSGLDTFVTGLQELGVQILSTGGTARAIREAGVDVTDVAEVTGFPEMLDGRVKTLHPVMWRTFSGISTTQRSTAASSTARFLASSSRAEAFAQSMVCTKSWPLAKVLSSQTNPVSWIW